MSNVAAATAQQLAFVRYQEENPFLDPEEFYQRWEDEESEVARLNQQSFRTSFGFGAGIAQDESLLELDGDTGNFSIGQADMSNPLVDPADLGNRSRHIDDITLMSDSAFRNEGKEQGAHRARSPEFDQDATHGKGQQDQSPVDELEEMDLGMDLEQGPESLEADTTPDSTGAVQQEELEFEMEEQEEEVEPEQPDVTEEEEEEEEERMDQKRQISSEQEAAEEEEQDQMEQETQDASEKDEEGREEDDHEEDEPSQEQPDPSMEAEQEAFDQDLEAEAFAAQMEEDEAAELAEMEAAKVAQMEEDEAEAAALEAAKTTQMEEDEDEAAESEAAKVAELKELLDLEGHDLLDEDHLMISPERQETPIALESAGMDEGRDKDIDIDLEHQTDADAAVHTNIDDRTNLDELRSPDAREQSPTMEEQELQEHEDGYMNVHEEDHIEQQEHEEQHDGPENQYFDDFPSELGMMSNGEVLPVSQPTTKKSAQ